MLHWEAVEDRGWEAEQGSVQGDDGGRALPRDDQAGRDTGRAAAALQRCPAARGCAGDPAGTPRQPREMGKTTFSLWGELTKARDSHSRSEGGGKPDLPVLSLILQLELAAEMGVQGGGSLGC